MRKVPRYVIFSALKVYWKHEEEEEGLHLQHHHTVDKIARMRKGESAIYN